MRRLRFAKQKPVFLLCDVQERFRDLIFRYEDVIHVGKTMVRGCFSASILGFCSDSLQFACTAHNVDRQRLLPTVFCPSNECRSRRRQQLGLLCL